MTERSLSAPPDLSVPPDQAQRRLALDPTRSILVQAPAGSGKTDLLTRRFLRLLAEVDDPSQIVAITFTRAAAAEMRNRILTELEKAAATPAPSPVDEFSMESLAHRALERSHRLGWNILEVSAQLRISTIDSFCGQVASRRPLLSTLGSGLEIRDNPVEFYRRAARATLMQLGTAKLAANTAELKNAIELLLVWRDNNWFEIEEHLVAMLAQRDRWMQDFVLDREQDWEQLRERLEQPFVRAIRKALAEADQLLARVPGAREEAIALAQFACANHPEGIHRELAEKSAFPSTPWESTEELEDAREAFQCLADLVLKSDGEIRESVDKRHGFPSGSKKEKLRLLALANDLVAIPGLQSSLHTVRALPPARYTDDEWQIVRAAFTLLHHAAAQLQVAFAEAGVTDFVEVAQAARQVLRDTDNQPTDAALAIADGIRHLLVDEFQDTSRRQHQLIASLVAAWPDPAGRTLFVVGDPMQSIYFFRDADAELFPRVQSIGLELPDGSCHPLTNVRLASNFRTAPELVAALNETFQAAFAANDGSGIEFNASEPARQAASSSGRRLELHVDFVPQRTWITADNPDSAQAQDDAADTRSVSQAAQIDQMVALIHAHLPRIEDARARKKRYRIAVLGRTKKSLVPVAQALREARIPFRAIELEPLAMRPEVLDALALARALYCIEDRVAWLGILRAPWCGLSLQDLHTLAGDGESLRRPIPELLRERANLLGNDSRIAINRLLKAMDAAPALRSALPASALGTWLEQVWLTLGGAACVDAQARANLDMLWRCLDHLPNGEPDLLGRGVTAALKDLNAQPDPAAAGDCGVQLMTIHKSKGLEFEVVIVPDLHARCGNHRRAMLSWLERGLAEPDHSGEITEFLIAPFQPKGSDRGKTKEWVDREYRERERQETRRIFYVAATRAREELHLFARAEYKRDTGELCTPQESLLSAAWPAFEEELRSRLATWHSDREEAEVEELAAGAENVLPLSAAPKHAIVRRLPVDFRPPDPLRQQSAQPRISGPGTAALFARHEGGMASRALGTAVHAMMEELARLRTLGTWDAARAGLAKAMPRIASHARSTGIDRNSAEQLAVQALDIALRASRDPVAEWILSPQPGAASEVRWTGMVNGEIHTVQVDRVFRAGTAPSSEGTDAWWIIDYKSAHPDALNDAEVLSRLRPLFAPQLGIYAGVLRGLHGSESVIRAGLYYPRLLAFDWWEL